MKIDVPGHGPKSDLLIIGEAPGAVELETKIPLTGPSGKEVEYHCEKNGVHLQNIYRTNVFKSRLSDGDPKIKKQQIQENFEESCNFLYKEVQAIDPNCILTLGGIALKAMTGHDGINLHRGSLIRGITGHKVIPTIHPAAYLKQRGEGGVDYSYKFIITLDFKKAIEESKTRDFNPPQRNLTVARNSLDVYRFLNLYKDHNLVSLDIETIRSIPVCIAFAFNKNHAISIPILKMDGWNAHLIQDHELAEIWKLIVNFLNDPRIKFIGQNLKFDLEKLDAPLGWINSLIKGRVHADTMLMMGCAYPVFPKSLAFSTSILTREPYYKDEGKEFNPKKDKFDKLFLYNAKDAAVTFEVYERLNEELREFGLTDFYYGHQNKLHDLYTEMEYNGLAVDNDKRSCLRKIYDARLKSTLEALKDITGDDVNINSPKQVSELLYKKLKLPFRAGTGEEILVALLGNHAKDSKSAKIINLILDGRKISKTINTYLDAAADYDGVMRFGYRITGTETGRSSTSVLKAPVRPDKMGIAIQTLTAHGEFGGDLREMFIPGNGRIFINADLSQIQARTVAFMADDWETLELFEKSDPHAWLAQVFFGGRIEDHMKHDGVEPVTRFVGKTLRYAGLYGAGKRKMMITVNTDAKKFGIDYKISEWKAGQFLEKYYDAVPKIKKVYWELIKEIARKDRILISPFGRRIQYFDRYDDDLLRTMYAAIPQSIDVDHLRQAIFRIKDRTMNDPDLRLHVEAHDGALFSCTEGKETYFGPIIKDELEKPIDFAKCSIRRGKLIVPAEIKIGVNYSDLRKMK